MKKLFITAIAAAGLIGLTPASADVFDDGIFETSEYSAFGDTFGVWDDNDDGLLSSNEFGDGWMKVGFSDSDGAFGAFDDNRNGFIEENEFFGDDEFGIMDADRDGAIGSDEWLF